MGAKLRRLGDVASLFLRSHLQNRNQEQESERVGQRQRELAQQQNIFREGQARDAQDLKFFEFLGQNPAAARKAWASGVREIGGRSLEPFVPTQSEDTSAALQIIGKNNLADLPGADIVGQMFPNAAPDALQQGLTSRTNVLRGNDVYQTGLEGERSYNNAQMTGFGQEAAAAANEPGVLGRKQEEGNLANRQRVDLEKQLSPIMVNRAGGEAAARMNAEWLDPRVIDAKLDFEKQKRIGELAQVGDKMQAEEVGKKNAAVKGLLPVYQQYRQLAVKVANSWAGAGSPASANVVGAISHLPAIGSFLASGLEAGHAAGVSLLDGKSGKDIAELNRITDTLAQGMANAVLGNRGQTTENDRRTAKNILASSFTDAKSLEDLLAITDRMFTLLPTVAGQTLSQDPFATPTQILEAVRAAAAGNTNQAPPPAGLDSIMSRPPRR